MVGLVLEGAGGGGVKGRRHLDPGGASGDGSVVGVGGQVLGNRPRPFVQWPMADQAGLVAFQVGVHVVGDLGGRARRVPQAHLGEVAIEVAGLVVIDEGADAQTVGGGVDGRDGGGLGGDLDAVHVERQVGTVEGGRHVLPLAGGQVVAGGVQVIRVGAVADQDVEAAATGHAQREAFVLSAAEEATTSDAAAVARTREGVGANPALDGEGGSVQRRMACHGHHVIHPVEAEHRAVDRNEVRLGGITHRGRSQRAGVAVARKVGDRAGSFVGVLEGPVALEVGLGGRVDYMIVVVGDLGRRAGLGPDAHLVHLAVIKILGHAARRYLRAEGDVRRAAEDATAGIGNRRTGLRTVLIEGYVARRLVVNGGDVGPLAGGQEYPRGHVGFRGAVGRQGEGDLAGAS